MNVITAYLTKSVMNSGGGGYTSNYIKKLKQAVTLGNLQQFIENFYAILTPDGQPGTMNKRTSAVSYYYNPFVQEKNGEGWDSITYPGKYAKGCSAVLSGVYGAAACQGTRPPGPPCHKWRTVRESRLLFRAAYVGFVHVGWPRSVAVAARSPDGFWRWAFRVGGERGTCG